MNPDQFQTVGHQLVDRIADFLASLPERPVSPGKTAGEIRQMLGDSPLMRPAELQVGKTQ